MLLTHKMEVRAPNSALLDEFLGLMWDHFLVHTLSIAWIKKKIIHLKCSLLKTNSYKLDFSFEVSMEPTKLPSFSNIKNLESRSVVPTKQLGYLNEYISKKFKVSMEPTKQPGFLKIKF